MIARDPTLKPTTAIKSTGVSDPSAIRRLRDKYHATRGELASDLKATGSALPKTAALKMPEQRKSAMIETPSKPEPVRAEPGPQCTPQQPPATPSDLLVLWCGLGMQSVTNALELQKSMVDAFLRMPPMSSALRSQLAINEMAVAWCPGTKRMSSAQ